MGFKIISALCFCFFGVVFSSTSSVPFLLWTGKSYFSTSHAEYEQPFLLDDIQYSLLETKDSESQAYPEVLVAFVADKMGSNEVSQLGAAFGASEVDQLKNLKGVLSGARNSIIIDNVYPSYNKISQALIQSMRIASPHGTIIKSKLPTDTCDSILAKLETSKNIFSNKMSDLVLISFSDYVDQRVDQCIQQVNSYVNEKSNSQYISLLSADQSRVQPQLTFKTEKLEEKNDIVQTYTLLQSPVNLYASRHLFAMQNNSNSTTPAFTGPQLISPMILFGIILGFVLIFFLWQGVKHLTLIEAPIRFSHTKLVLSREY